MYYIYMCVSVCVSMMCTKIVRDISSVKHNNFEYNEGIILGRQRNCWMLTISNTIVYAHTDYMNTHNNNNKKICGLRASRAIKLLSWAT